MTAPNIVSTASVVAKTELAQAITTATAILTNTASSGKLYKISALFVANKSPSNATVTANLVKGAGSNAVTTKVANSIIVPVNSTLVISDRNSPLYVEENAILNIAASVNNALDVICAYEEIGPGTAPASNYCPPCPCPCPCESSSSGDSSSSNFSESSSSSNSSSGNSSSSNLSSSSSSSVTINPSDSSGNGGDGGGSGGGSSGTATGSSNGTGGDDGVGGDNGGGVPPGVSSANSADSDASGVGNGNTGGGGSSSADCIETQPANQSNIRITDFPNYAQLGLESVINLELVTPNGPGGMPIWEDAANGVTVRLAEAFVDTDGVRNEATWQILVGGAVVASGGAENTQGIDENGESVTILDDPWETGFGGAIIEKTCRIGPSLTSAASSSSAGSLDCLGVPDQFALSGQVWGYGPITGFVFNGPTVFTKADGVWNAEFVMVKPATSSSNSSDGASQTCQEACEIAVALTFRCENGIMSGECEIGGIGGTINGLGPVEVVAGGYQVPGFTFTTPTLSGAVITCGEEGDPPTSNCLCPAAFPCLPLPETLPPIILNPVNPQLQVNVQNANNIVVQIPNPADPQPGQGCNGCGDFYVDVFVTDGETVYNNIVELTCEIGTVTRVSQTTYKINICPANIGQLQVPITVIWNNDSTSILVDVSVAYCEQTSSSSDTEPQSSANSSESNNSDNSDNNAGSDNSSGSEGCIFIECGGTGVYADCHLIPGNYVLDCAACECVDAGENTNSDNGDSSANSDEESSSSSSSSSDTGDGSDNESDSSSSSSSSDTGDDGNNESDSGENSSSNNSSSVSGLGVCCATGFDMETGQQVKECLGIMTEQECLYNPDGTLKQPIETALSWFPETNCDTCYSSDSSGSNTSNTSE